MSLQTIQFLSQLHLRELLNGHQEQFSNECICDSLVRILLMFYSNSILTIFHSFSKNLYKSDMPSSKVTSNSFPVYSSIVSTPKCHIFVVQLLYLGR